MEASLKISGKGLAGAGYAIALDGEEIPAVQRVDLHIDARGIAVATIELPIYKGADVDAGPEVCIGAETHALLVKLGWKPPEV